MNLFYVFLATDTTLSASTSLQTTQSLESAALRTENMTGMIVEAVLETYFLSNYGKIGIVMLELQYLCSLLLSIIHNLHCLLF